MSVFVRLVSVLGTGFSIKWRGTRSAVDTKNAARNTLRHGFSLIELAIILTVSAVIMAGALDWLSPTSADYVQKMELTQHRLKVIRHALLQFRLLNNRLPCPADNQLNLYSSNSSGVENCNVAGQKIGTIPTRTLGLPLEFQTDGWDRRFTYHLATAVCGQTASPSTCSATYVGAADLATAETDTNYLTVFTSYLGGDYPTASTGVRLTYSAVAVVVSHGVNGLGAWKTNNSGGWRMPLTSTDIRDQYNIAGSAASAPFPNILNESRNAFTAQNADNDTRYWLDKPHGDISGAANTATDDMGFHLTRRDIEKGIIEDFPPIPQAECVSFSTALQTMRSLTQLQRRIINDAGNANHDTTEVPVQPFMYTTITNISAGTHTGEFTSIPTAPLNQRLPLAEGLAAIFWTMQSVCSAYYSTYYSETNPNFMCPVGAGFISSNTGWWNTITGGAAQDPSTLLNNPAGHLGGYAKSCQ